MKNDPLACWNLIFEREQELKAHGKLQQVV